MQTSLSSTESLGPISHDNLTRAILRTTGKRQVVRLVNASNLKMMFTIKTISNISDRKIEISPRKGTIAPRGYANIVVEDLSYNIKLTSETYQLNLIYWVSSSSKYNKGLVKIDLAGGQVGPVETTEKQSFIWILLSIIRSTFLVVLVIYNVILIKQHSL